MTTVRYRVFAMNFLAALINYGDRVAISAAAPFILAEYKFSPAVWGVILSAFFWTYAPSALLGGFLADRIGIRRTYTIFMLIWSLTIPLTASAWDAAAFIIARLLFGVGEGPQGPLSTKLTSNWFPRRQTSTMLNLAQSGTTIGPILATPFVVWVCFTAGWRTTFVILGAVGLVWTAVWWFVGRDKPDVHPSADAAEVEYITRDHVAEPAAAKQPRGELWRLVRSRYVIALAIAFFAYSWVLFMFLTWYPTYLVQARHVTTSQLASMATIPWITATIGLIGGGVLADRLIKRYSSLITPRKWVIVGCLIAVAVCFGLSPFVSSPVVALVLVSLATLFLLASYQYQALIVARAPQGHVGRLAGVIQACSTVAGIIAPIVTGAVVQGTGSFTGAFVIGAAVALLGAVAVLVFVHDKRTVHRAGDVVTAPEATATA